MSRWQLVVAAVVAVVLVLSGIVIGQLWAVRAHVNTDHVQHHMVILVVNELIRRDPSLAAFVDAALGAPEMVTAPAVETDLPEPGDAPVPEQP